MGDLEHHWQSRCRNCSFQQSGCIWNHLNLQCQTRCRNCWYRTTFTTIWLCMGPFGAPMPKWCQKLHFSYSGCIWAKFCRTGKKCLKCLQLTLTLRVAQPKRLVWETCPFGFLAIYIWQVSGWIFPFLRCQETCAGKGWCFLKFQEIWICETAI